MLAASDLRQQGGRPFQLARIGQELDPRVPAVPVADREREEPPEQVVGRSRRARLGAGRGRPRGGRPASAPWPCRRDSRGADPRSPPVQPASRVGRGAPESPRAGPELALDPRAGRGLPAGHRCPGLREERRAGEVPVGGLVARAQAGSGERVEGGVDLDQPLLSADPVVEPSALVVVRRRRTAASTARGGRASPGRRCSAPRSTVAGPPARRGRPRRDPEPGDRAPGGLVPRARLGGHPAARAGPTGRGRPRGARRRPAATPPSMPRRAPGRRRTPVAAADHAARTTPG